MRSSAMLTGFVSLEEVQQSSSSSDWKPCGSVLGSLARPAWVYAVLQQGRLRCYRCRADLKLNRAPSRVLLLDLEATRVGARQSLLVTSRATNATFRLRVHATSATTYLQWLTALYLARLDASGERTPTTKRVTFNEETSEYTCETSSSDDDEEEPVDPGELFYSPADLAAFRAARGTERREKKPLRVGRKIVRSLVARLRSKGSSEEDDE